MNEKDELLKQLRDVELPQVDSSLAPGWWLLMLLLVLLLLAVFLFNRRRQARLWQRQARAELQGIRNRIESEPSNLLLSRCSRLARQVVLAVDQRDQVAVLHGEAWLEKLDDVCARPEFTQGIGRLLLDQPYQRQPEFAAQDLNALCDSVEALINGAAKYKLVDYSATASAASGNSTSC